MFTKNLNETFVSPFLVVIFSKEWEVAESMSTVTKYKAGTGEDITATIGIHIGLKGVNVTLKGIDHTSKSYC